MFRFFTSIIRELLYVLCLTNFHSCTVHLDTIESLIYPSDAQLDCSKNVKIYIKIYMRGAATCIGFLHPLSGSYYVCFAWHIFTVVPCILIL